MIYIKKGEPVESVQKELKEKAASSEWQHISETDTTAMRRFFDQLSCKKEIRQCLLEEQHYLCAYCMSVIENKELHMSIEHLVPLSKCKEQVFDYKNYLGVCKGGADIPRDRNKCICCDASKGNKELQCINPFDEDQMNQIRYLSDGIIYYERRKFDSEEYKKAIYHAFSCIEEIAYRNKWISKDTLLETASGYKTDYGEYLKFIAGSVI